MMTTEADIGYCPNLEDTGHNATPALSRCRGKVENEKWKMRSGGSEKNLMSEVRTREMETSSLFCSFM